MRAVLIRVASVCLFCYLRVRPMYALHKNLVLYPMTPEFDSVVIVRTSFVIIDASVRKSQTLQFIAINNLFKRLVLSRSTIFEYIGNV